MAEQPKPSLPLFPIQLRKVDISEVAYSCQGFSVPSILPTDKFDLSVAVSQIKPVANERLLQVTITFSCANNPGEPQFPYPYSLKIALNGEFVVGDMSRFNLDDAGIIKWGEKNGVMCLMPFLRETVFSFTQKTGFRPILIPLIETSAFNVRPPSSPQPSPPTVLPIEGLVRP